MTTELDLNKYNATQPQSEDFNLFVINLLKDGDSYSLIAGDSNLQYVIEDWMQDVLQLQLIGIQIKDFDSWIESAVSCNQSFCLLLEADKISYSTTEQVSVKRNKPVYETTYHSATELPYKLSLTVSCVFKEQEYDEAVSEFKKTQAELDNQFLFDLLKAHNMEDNSGANKLLGKLVAEYGIGQKSTIIKQFDNYIECFK